MQTIVDELFHAFWKLFLYSGSYKFSYFMVPLMLSVFLITHPLSHVFFSYYLFDIFIILGGIFVDTVMILKEYARKARKLNPRYCLPSSVIKFAFTVCTLIHPPVLPSNTPAFLHHLPQTHNIHPCLLLVTFIQQLVLHLSILNQATVLSINTSSLLLNLFASQHSHSSFFIQTSTYLMKVPHSLQQLTVQLCISHCSHYCIPVWCHSSLLLALWMKVTILVFLISIVCQSHSIN